MIIVNRFGENAERHSLATDFSYVYNQTEGEFDLVLLQDMEILKYLRGEIEIKKKCPIVAFVCEVPDLFDMKEVYEAVKNNPTRFDKIICWDPDLARLPNAVLREGAEINQWNDIREQAIDPSWFQVYPKSKFISFISSNKTINEGHRFRMKCVWDMDSNFKDKVSIYGRGLNNIKSKLDGLKDFRFSITMENHRGVFSEKILDCFLAGSIPIYYGPENIGKWFNKDGIIQFSSLEELQNIVSNLTDKDYDNRIEAVKDNLERALYYAEDNNKFYNRYLKDLVE